MQADKWIIDWSQYTSLTTMSHPLNPSTLNPYAVRQVRIVTHDNCNHIFLPQPQTTNTLSHTYPSPHMSYTPYQNIPYQYKWITKWFHKGHPNHSLSPLPSSHLLQADQWIIERLAPESTKHPHYNSPHNQTSPLQLTLNSEILRKLLVKNI